MSRRPSSPSCPRISLPTQRELCTFEDVIIVSPARVLVLAGIFRRQTVINHGLRVSAVERDKKSAGALPDKMLAAPLRVVGLSDEQPRSDISTARRRSSVWCDDVREIPVATPPRRKVIVWTKCDEKENRMIRLIGLWLVGCSFCVTPVAADEDMYDGPTAIKPLTVTPQPQHSAPPNTVCDFEHQCYPEKGGPAAPAPVAPPGHCGQAHRAPSPSPR